MTPRYAEATDPIFLQVFDLLSRITNREPIDSIHEGNRLEAAFDRADRLLGSEPEWTDTKFLIAAWIDEMMRTAHDYDDRPTWEQRLMVKRLFPYDDYNAAVEYFNRAEGAQSKRWDNAAETSFIGVLLGFRGLYLVHGGTSDDQAATNHNLPGSLEEWVRLMHPYVTNAQRASQDEDVRPPIGANYPTAIPGPDWQPAIKYWTWGSVLVAASFVMWAYYSN